MLTLVLDVVKSRVQLRPTPPTGTPVGYIASELRLIVQEGGLCVFNSLVPYEMGDAYILL